MTTNEQLESPVETTALARPERVPLDSAVLDLRTNFLSMDAETMAANLAEYDRRRNALRKWIKEHLIPGVHYGYPPGLEPKSEVRSDGKTWYRQVSRGKETWYPEDQWQPKPSLYKPTADMMCEAFALKAEFVADLEAWQQAGSQAGMFITKCRLFSLTSGEEIAQGRGARKIGDKGGDVNNALKMSQKSAKVDATINAFGLSDLFTQDLEDMAQPPLHANPDADPNAPVAQPRGDRITKEDARALFSAWADLQARLVLSADPKLFEEWVEGVTGLELAKIGNYKNWTRADFDKCLEALKQEAESHEPPKGETMFGD